MKKLALALSVIMLSGCSWMKFWEGDSSSDDVEVREPAKLVSFDETVEVKRNWKTGGLSGLDAGISNMRLAISDNAVFAADAKGNVMAVDKNDGKRLWRRDLKARLSGGVGYGGGNVYVGSIEGQIYALSATSGEVLWKAGTSSEILASPAANADMVAVISQNGRLEAFNAIDGSSLWSFEVDTPILTIRGSSSPIATDTMIIAGFDNGKLYGLRSDNGVLLWEARVAAPEGSTELERIVDVDGDLLLVDDIVYAGSFQGQLGAFARGTGRNLWYQKVSTHEGPGYGSSQVYVSDEEDIVRAYRSNSGQPVWSNDQLYLRKLTAPVAIGGYVAVADEDGHLHVLSGEYGSFVGREKVDGSGVSAPMLEQYGNLYVLDNSGNISSYSLQ
ncbi:MAG: outer membrane protein assembly factor BamB [bacterium]